MPSQEEVRRYRRLKRITGGADLAITAGVLILLLVAGWSHTLREVAEDWSASRLQAISLYFVLLFALLQGLTFPLDMFGGHVLERRIGLSQETLGSWLKDWAKGATLIFAFGLVAVLGIYTLLDEFPETWWLMTAIGFSVFVIVLARMAPVLILPLFFKLEPLPEGEVRDRLVSLSRRVGVPVVSVFIWKLAEKSRRSNAAVVGWGGTRRVLVADTMLSSNTPEEIETVLAHELGHHVRGDIPKAILVQVPLTFLGFFVIHRALELLAGPLNLASPADIAGLPLLALVTVAGSLALLPVVNAYSRWREREADRFALRVTDDPDSFIGAMEKLAEQNLADRSPNRIMELLFASHPSIERRVAMARAWRAAEQPQPGD